MKRIGLFVSDDSLSRYAFEKLNKDFEVFAFSFFPVSSIPSEIIQAGDLENMMELFKKKNIRKIVLIGKISPSLIFKDIHPSGRKFLEKIERWQAEEILKNLTEFLEKNGIEILPLDKIFKEDIVEEKIYTERKPTEREMEDIELGFEIGFFLTKYRIGQSLSIKRGMVIAVEGMEGTDRMIERSGKYCKGFVLVKVAGRNKDTRFDLPTIGPETVRNMWKAGGNVIAVEAKKSIIFVQSQVPYHTELAWILNCITKIPELKRMTQFKQKSKEHPEKVNVGLFDYPVLMASDILLYQTDLVPVGKDQKQHIELTRSLARRFNKEFGNTFKIPKALIKKQSEKIMGLDNPLKKMSKSAKDSYNYIALTDTPELIREKIKKAVTDSGKEIKYDKEKKPGISNLLTIYSLFSKKSISQLENQYKNKTYAEFKKDLAEIIIKSLTPFQEKLKYYQSKPEYVKNILEQGRKRAEKISKLTIKEVKKKLGLPYS